MSEWVTAVGKVVEVRCGAVEAASIRGKHGPADSAWVLFSG